MAARLGHTIVQVPTSDMGLFDLQVAASNLVYWDDIKGRLAQYGIEITDETYFSHSRLYKSGLKRES